MRDLTYVVNSLLAAEARQATKFLAANQVIRATRCLENGRIPKRGNIDIRITVGTPNYAEREFIKACKRAGEPFPVKKVQFKFPRRSRA
jgi:hypothetical protein